MYNNRLFLGGIRACNIVKSIFVFFPHEIMLVAGKQKLALSAWAREVEGRLSKWLILLFRIQVLAPFTPTQHHQDCQAFNLNY